MIQETKIIKSSKSWKDLDLKINELVQRKKSKLAGSVFELLSKLYFKIAPEYKTKFKNVYLLNEVPNKLKRKLNLPNTDEGIDLIAETKNNEYWAIQCKYRSNKNETLKIKGDLATFNNLAFTNCKNISHGIVCTTINKPPKKIKLLKSIGFELLNTWTGLDKNDSELFKQIKDFLGKSYIGNDSEMITYDMAKKIVKKLKINSAKDYNKLNIKIKNKYKIPSNPYLSYKKNWRGWIDFLGK